MDPVQTDIIFISLTITALIVVLGIQVFFILKEIRIALIKINSMLDDGKKVTSTMSDTVEGASGFIDGIVTAFSFISKFKKRRDSNE